MHVITGVNQLMQSLNRGCEKQRSCTGYHTAVRHVLAMVEDLKPFFPIDKPTQRLPTETGVLRRRERKINNAPGLPSPEASEGALQR